MGINNNQENYTQNKDSSLARIIVVLIIQVCYFITFPFLSYSFPWSFTNILLISITIQAPFTTSHSISKWPIYKADSPSLPSPFLTKPIVLSNTYYPWYNSFPLIIIFNHFISFELVYQQQSFIILISILLQTYTILILITDSFLCFRSAMYWDMERVFHLHRFVHSSSNHLPRFCSHRNDDSIPLLYHPIR